jgi:hypothetical protein
MADSGTPCSSQCAILDAYPFETSTGFPANPEPLAALERIAHLRAH